MPHWMMTTGHAHTQALSFYTCATDEIERRERRKPKRMVQCPLGLEELDLSDIPSMWGAASYQHIRLLRKLHLDSDDRLDALQLAAMTALQSLHASTPAVYKAVTEALPALTRLTRLELMARLSSRSCCGS